MFQITQIDRMEGDYGLLYKGADIRLNQECLSYKSAVIS